MTDLWKGLRPAAREHLTRRDYCVTPLAERLATSGVEVRELIEADRTSLAGVWIPGVEIFARKIFPQRHRGFFGEFIRAEEGVPAKIGFWPDQWATACMFAATAKGFHIHPPHIPEGTQPEDWFRRLFIEEPENHALRAYSLEQWDVMFFTQGTGEMILVDERAGLERRVMRFLIEGDNLRGPNNAGVIIPPGVAHAIRAEGASNVVMVYGTSTKFNPDFEGRIASSVESAPLPEEWERYLGK